MAARLEREEGVAMAVEQVRSSDGTTLAFERVGAGPAVVLVAGALGTRGHDGHQALARLLAPHCTVLNYDRRGRGDSGDTAPYAPAREYEDLGAIITAAGGRAAVYGISSGAILALEAANVLAGKVTRLALYEPPFIIDESHAPLPVDYVERLDAAVAAGRRGDAVEIFMRDAIGLPEEYLAAMRADPSWAGLEAIAHTIAYDGRIVRDLMMGRPLPTGRWAAVTMPTLAIAGAETEPFFHSGARALVADLPNAEYRILAGQGHAVDPAALAPVLIDFFAH